MDSIRAGTSLGPPLFIQGHEALNPQTAPRYGFGSKAGSGLCQTNDAPRLRGDTKGVAAPAKKGRITRAAGLRSDLPARRSLSPPSRDHRADPPLCQDRESTKKERGASCRPPCLLFSWQCIEGPEGSRIGPDAFRLCGLLDLRDKVRSLMLARLAGPVCRTRATAFSRSHAVKCVSLIRFYQLQAPQVKDTALDWLMQKCG